MVHSDIHDRHRKHPVHSITSTRGLKDRQTLLSIVDTIVRGMYSPCTEQLLQRAEPPGTELKELLMVTLQYAGYKPTRSLGLAS